MCQTNFRHFLWLRALHLANSKLRLPTMSRNVSAAPTPPVSRLPLVIPYRSPLELLLLRHKFYRGSPSDKRDALATVEVLQLRGKLPHGVECTALFTAATLRDQNNNGADSYLVRSSYAMALVRFVNGVLDPFQQGQYASALVNIAKVVGLPLSFVEIRHAATHEELPSLEALRQLVLDAQAWLYTHFWLELPEGTNVGGWPQVRPSRKLDTRAQIILWLKIFKRSRKKALDAGLGRRPSSVLAASEDERSFWNAVDGLVSVAGKPDGLPCLVDVMVADNFLVKRGVDAKTKTAIKMYMPLLEVLGPHARFALVVALITQCSPLTPNTFDESAAQQAGQWLHHLVPSSLDGPFPLVAIGAQMGSRDEAVKYLSNCLSLLESVNTVRVLVEKILHSNDNAGVASKKKFSLPPLLDDILSGTPSSEEKVEPDEVTKRRKTTTIFESHPNWAARPFGVAS